jgi:hypothetical protein
MARAQSQLVDIGPRRCLANRAHAGGRVSTGLPKVISELSPSLRR